MRIASSRELAEPWIASRVNGSLRNISQVCSIDHERDFVDVSFCLDVFCVLEYRACNLALMTPLIKMAAGNRSLKIDPLSDSFPCRRAVHDADTLRRLPLYQIPSSRKEV